MGISKIFRKKGKNAPKKLKPIGPIEFIYRWFLYKTAKDFKYNLSVVMTIKDEAEYIAEFIEYHKLVGVNHFYIYNNNGTDNTAQVLASYIKSGLVSYSDFPGQKVQRRIYAAAIKKYKRDTKWMAIIDADEFMVPIKNKTITEFLQGFDGYSQIGIHWLLYGSSEQERKTDGLVIERFIKNEGVGNPHKKSIVNPRAVIKPNVHNCRVFGKTVNQDKEKTTGPTDDRAPIDIIRINHYVIKSRDEFIIKKNRGRSNGKNTDLDDSFFARHDKNNVSDDMMVKYLKPIKTAISKSRS